MSRCRVAAWLIPTALVVVLVVVPAAALAADPIESLALCARRRSAAC
ncbi:MAG TPA: hypothetical protein VK548_05035 [Candidatus Acidoferrum sp.]|nr:hypothetical protein [Candidatus Acidoferrum sp.]